MSEPTVAVHGEGYLFEWEQIPYLILIDHIHEKYGEPYGEISVMVRQDSGLLRTIIGPKSAGLMMTRALPAAASEIAARMVGYRGEIGVKVMQEMLEDAARLAMREYRSGPPLIDLARCVPDMTEIKWLVSPLIPQRQATLIVANGGGGKSYLGLTLATCVAGGIGFPGIGRPQVSGPVLYLDWESDEQDHSRRLGLIQKGFGVHIPDNRLVYQKPRQEIRSCPWIAARIAELQPTLVVVDSVGYAMGGDLKEAGPVTEMFRTVNGWNTSVLLLHHQNREGEFYGSIYLRNSARSFWEMDSVHEHRGLSLSLRQEKMNNGPVFPSPLGLHLNFEADHVLWTGLNVYDHPEVAATLPLSERIRRTLEDARATLTYNEVSSALGVGTESVKRVVKENPWVFHIMVGGGSTNDAHARVGLKEWC